MTLDYNLITVIVVFVGMILVSNNRMLLEQFKTKICETFDENMFGSII